MATKEFWELDPENQKEILLRVTGKDEEDLAEAIEQALKISDGESGSLCLEIGAGYGRLLPHMLSRFSFAYGVDSSISLVALSTRHLRSFNKCRVILGDGHIVPFPAETFDFVYSFTCFQHIVELHTIRENFREAHRVLRPGHKFRLQTVLGKRGKDLHDGYVFETPAELSNELLAAGFRMTAHTVDDERSWIWITATK